MFAYYMLPARAGELLIGAVMAMFLSQRSYNLNVLARLFLGVLGLGLICYSMFFFTSETLFPGYNSLVPTLGAAFLILTGSVGGGFITRFLSLKVAVLIGLISYSLYLWHWPILALYRYVYGDVGFLAGIFLLALMFVFSFLSYRFVEKPFRKLNLSFKLVLLRLIAPAVAFLLLIICFFIVSKGFGLYAYNSHYIDKMNSLQPDDPAIAYRYVCQKSLLGIADLSRPDCIINGYHEPKILLWGDSNAAHYIGILGAYAESAGFSFRNIAHSSCPPLLEGAGSIVRLEISGNCDASVEVVKKTLDKYEMIILGGAWDTYARHPDFFLLFEETLNSLVNAGKDVLILGVIPRPINVDRSCEIKSLKQLVPDCDSEDSGSKIPNEVNSKLKELASKFEQISYYDVTDGICPEGECSTVIDDKLVYFDRSHFSMEGSWLIGKTIIEQQGLPTLFNDFSKYSSKTDSLDSTGLDWVEIVSFQNSFAPLTRGSAFRSAVDDGFLLEDSSEENYESVRLRLPVDSNTSEYYVKVVFSNCSDTLPMLRLREQLTDKRNQYDAQFDCNSNKLVNMDDLEPEDVSVTVLESGSIEIIVRYTVASELDSLVMELFPAVGPSLRRYNRASVGSIVLNSIDVAVKGEI